MATRFYLPRWDGRATPQSTAAGSQWNQTANSFSGATGVLAATTKGATAPTSTTSGNFTKSSATSPWNTLHLQGVSDTIDVAQSITGTFSGVFRMGETATSANISLQVVLRVVSRDGSTERGVLYPGHSTANNSTAGSLGQEAPTTAATRIIPSGTALSSVSAQPGDRIVVEVGTRAETTNTTTAGFIQFGDNTGTADHSLGTGNTSSLVPWVELSQTLTFGTPVVTGAVATALGALSATSSGTVTPGSGDVIIDDFNDNSISAAWTNWTGTNVAETGGQLELTTSTTAFAYFGLQRVSAETITGAFIGTRVVAVGNQSLLGYGAYPVSLVFSSGNEAYWIITGGTAYAYTALSGSYVERGSVTHADGRTYVVGESGDNIIWKYSDDLASWTTAATLADPFSGDQTVTPYIMVGTDQANGSTTTFVVDDFGWYDTTSSGATVTGTVTTALGALTASAAGTPEHPGVVTTALGALSAAATGSRSTPGTASAGLGALAATAVAVRATAGSAGSALGGLSATGAGVRSVAGSSAATLGALAATTAGTREVLAAAAGTLGGLTASADGGGLTDRTGSIASTLGALSASAAGTRTAFGASAAALGALAGSASGSRTVLALAPVSLGQLAASAAGLVAHVGAVATDMGGLTATVTVAPPVPPITVRPDSGVTPRPAGGSTTRPAAGSTARPAGGVTARPYAGTTARP